MSIALAQSARDPDAERMQTLFALAVPMELALTDASAELTEMSQRLSEQTRLLHLVEASAGQMAQTNATTSERLTIASEAAAGAGGRMAEATRGALATITLAHERASGLASTANAIEVQAMAAEGQVTDLRRSSDGIQKIAREIQMLAVNAGVEAARHGVAGRGFAVIAEAIKALADQTRSATDQMSKHLTGLGVTISSLQGSCRTNLDHARSMDEAASDSMRHSDSLGAAQDAVSHAVAQLGQAVAPMDQLARASQEIGQGIQAGLSQLDRVKDRIHASTARFDDIRKLSEGITACVLSAHSPIADLADSCQATARRIGELFEDAIRRGEIGNEDLFDDRYRPIEGTRPEQFLSRFSALADRLLPEPQEQLLGSDPRVVFCAAVDRNGYLPTHNRTFSQPQSNDPVWNAQHCRNRRIFNDRTGLAAARNRDPVLLQSYRRDMGGGRHVPMSELTSPIFVNGRHWGGLRVGFHLAGDGHGRVG